MSVLNNNLTLKTLVVGPMAVNCYVVSHKVTKEAFIIDPGDDFESIKRYLGANKLRPQFIIHTHGHYDHIGADSNFNLPIYIHEFDRDCLIDTDKNLSEFLGAPFKLSGKIINTLKNNDELKFAAAALKIMHTPGHTPGGICILLNEALFSGDTLFACGIGRTDFPGASHDLLISSIKEKLFQLADNVVVYPGHGEPTTIGREKRENPFLSN